MPFVIDKFKSKKGASVSEEFALFNWKVHGIMNTSGLLQETRSIHDSMNLPKIEFIAYIYILL